MVGIAGRCNNDGCIEDKERLFIALEYYVRRRCPLEYLAISHPRPLAPLAIGKLKLVRVWMSDVTQLSVVCSWCWRENLSCGLTAGTLT